MKRYIYTFVALAATLLLGSCTVKNNIPTKTAAGQNYDTVVICADEAWNAGLGEAVEALLEEPTPGLTRPEGLFTIVRRVAADKASNIDRMYGNLLVVNINAAVSEPSFSVEKNVYARPQTVVVVTAPTLQSAIGFLTEAGAAIRDVMEEGERRKSNNYYSSRSADELMADFKATTGFEMLIPQGFFKATTADKSLTWYLRDYPTKAQYIFTYESEYTSPEDLTPKWLMMSLDNKLASISSKGAAGSYMGVNENEPTYASVVDVAGREWVELRGRWEVTNDFMGGPFVSFSSVDAEQKKILTVMFALYAPEDPQRNLLRELEHLFYTLK
ncbi:MAG: DUF4837 family protein [Alistipes sp.]|nr:DUF4837 family protein [Alistipes sp.]